MTTEEQAELSARRSASETAYEGWPDGADRIDAAERAIHRRLIAAMLPGGLVEYWRMIEAEVRK